MGIIGEDLSSLALDPSVLGIDFILEGKKLFLSLRDTRKLNFNNDDNTVYSLRQDVNESR